MSKPRLFRVSVLAASCLLVLSMTTGAWAQTNPSSAPVTVDRSASNFDEGRCLAVFLESDVAVVDKDWLIECVGTFRVRPIWPFLAHEAEANDLTRVGYARELIETQDLL